MKDYIFFLRPLAAFMVVCTHITATLDTSANYFVYILNKISFWAVPVFIMISGALILSSKIPPPTAFYVKRLKRLLPAFVIWNLFYLVLFQLGSREYSISERLYQFVIRLYSASHLWYLPMFLALMLLAPIVKMFIEGVKPTQKLLYFLLMLCFTELVIRQIKAIEPNVEWITIFNEYLIFFIMGYVFDRYVKIKNLLYITIPLIILVIAGLLLETGTHYKFFSYISLTNTLISMLVYLLFLNFVSSKPNKMMLALSDASFGIYLIHMAFIAVLSSLGTINSNNFVFYIILVFIGSFIFTYFLRLFKFGRLIT